VSRLEKKVERVKTGGQKGIEPTLKGVEKTWRVEKVRRSNILMKKWTGTYGVRRGGE